MKKDCEGHLERIVRYLDGELEAGEQERLEAHLKGCSGCRGEVDSLRSMRGLLRGVPVLTSSAEERASVVAEARRRSRPGPGLLDRLGLRLVWTDLVTAGAVAASIFLAVVLLEGRGASDPGQLQGSVPVLSFAELIAHEEQRDVEVVDGFEVPGRP